MSARRQGELPLPDYDQLPASTLEHRIRSLTADELEQLLRHEREHAARPAVIRMLTARKEQLESGATPSPGGSGPPLDQPHPSHKGSPVSPATSPEPIHPPPHGTLDRPGRPKGNRP